MITQRKIRACSNPRNEGVKSGQIPLDLVIAILLKLPAKSIARFRCVSKLWDSTFRGPYFTESFFNIQSSRPKLLLACRCRLDGNMLFFSSPQPQSSCLTITANFQLGLPINCPSDICRPVRGLVCGNCQTDRDIFATEYPEQLICNPSTGQCLTLPKVKQGGSVVKSCLGYDPIDRQLKILCMTQYNYGRPHYDPIIEHQVLTLGTGSWRMIKCDLPHFAVTVDRRDFGEVVYDWICINGVLYYLAAVSGCYDGFSHIVCFDIRSEKLSFIERAQNMQGELESALVNYKGKLAMLQPNFSNKGILAKLQPNFSNIQFYNGITVWVLEDAEKHQWSKYTYVLPSPWVSIVARTKLRFAGMTNTGEVVWSPYYISSHESFFLVYYNPDRNSITRVGIQGMEAYKNCMAYVFLDHVEDVKLMATI